MSYTGYSNSIKMTASKVFGTGDAEVLADVTPTTVTKSIDIHAIVFPGPADGSLRIYEGGSAAGALRFEAFGQNAGAPHIQISPPVRVGANPWVVVAGTGTANVRIFYTACG